MAEMDDFEKGGDLDMDKMKRSIGKKRPSVAKKGPDTSKEAATPAKSAFASKSARAGKPAATGAPAAAPVAEHTVESGDTLGGIALKYYKSAARDKWMAIYEANKETIGDNPSLIKLGQVLKIPNLD